MYTLLKPILIRKELLKRKTPIFTSLDFERVFHLPKFKAKYFLKKYTKEGFFTRLKKDVYTLESDQPSEEEIANFLYKPSYLSFEYVLAKYGIIPEMVYTITSATTKPTRVIEAGGRVFSYLTIKKTAFTGYIPLKRGGKIILIAESEKALVDYLYFVSLGKKAINERLNISRLDKQKILRYAELFKRQGLNKLIRKIL